MTALVFLLLSARPCAAAAIDLHLHLRMDAGFPLFRGYATEAPSPATGKWDILKNQVSVKDLEAADVRLVMATLYSFDVVSTLRGGVMKDLARQNQAVRDWIAQNPKAVLVTKPEEADAVLKSKDYKLGVILAVEGAHGIDSFDDILVLREAGVRMITVAHMQDNGWVGACEVRYWPFGTCVAGGKDGGKRNALGLTSQGRRLVPELVHQGILLDLAHISDAGYADVIALYPKLPLLFSHEAMRELTPCERAVSSDQLRHLREVGGMVGLIFKAQFIGPAVSDLVRHAQVAARDAGPGALAIGSDYNGFIDRIKGLETTAGYARALAALKAAGLPQAGRSAENFVVLWRKYLAFAHD